MKRNIEEKLTKWIGSEKPFMLVGARQVGKTYILDKFCKSQFKNYLYLNLEKESAIREIFDETIIPNEIIKQIELYKDIKIDIDSTVIFFDEIQVSEKAVTSLKYFCEDENKYNIVCAGSLLGVALNRFESSFPVGKIYKETLYPFNFDEFLLALNKENLLHEIIKCFNQNISMPKYLHEKLLSLYKDYLFVGGMPASILEYVKADFNLQHFDRNIKRNLLDSYVADMSKYSTNSESIKIRKIYNSIPKQLGQDTESSKFNYKLVQPKTNKRSIKSSLDWLLDSNLLLESSLIETPRLPLRAYKNENIFKMFLSDVGLLCELSDIAPRDMINLDTFKGMLTENFIAQTFKTNNIDLNYWRSSNSAEIDFIIVIDGNIIPVEVKSATNTKAKSLKVYQDKYNPEYSIKICSLNFGFHNFIKTVPLYAAFLVGSKK